MQLLRLWLVLVAGVCGLSLWWHGGTGLNNDHLGLLRATRLMLSGAIPYLEYAEINPPLITLLYAIPTLAAQATGLGIAHALHVFAVALILISLVATHRVLRQGGYSPAVSHIIVSALALAVCLVSFISDVFADRTHLIVVLLAPFIAWCAPLPQRAGVPIAWRMAASVMAAIAICLKPHYALVYLVTLIARLWRTRSLSSILTPEDALIPAFGLAYLLLIALFFQYYFIIIVPLSVPSYGHLGWTWHNRVIMIRTLLLESYGAPLFVALLGVVASPPHRLPAGIPYLLGITLAGGIAYATSSGWWYEQYPYSAFAFITTLCLCTVLAARPRVPLRLVFLGCTLIMLHYNYVLPSYSRAQMDHNMQQARGYPWANLMPNPGARDRIEYYLNRNPKFLLLGTTIFGETLVYAGKDRTHIGRFDFLWPLPGLIAMKAQGKKPAMVSMLLSYVTASLAQDIGKYRPGLVIVDVSPTQRGMPGNYNLLEIPMKDETFRRAWSAYEKAETVRDCSTAVSDHCAYDIYLRIPGK